MNRALAVLVLLCATARADKPSVNEVQELALDLRNLLLDPDDIDVRETLDLLALPFWFEGGDASCKREWQLARHGTFVTDDNARRFLRCLAESHWTHSIDGPTGEFFALDKVPPGFRPLKQRLAKLRKTHTVVASHFCPAAPGTFWTIYGALRGTDGQARIDTIMIWSDPDGDCR